MKHILELKGINKKYGKIQALTNVNLTLHHGIYALLGPNGSGKSTLMNLIAGLLKPSGGTILYNGKEIDKCAALYRGKLGYMPQYPAMYPSFSVLEFLFYLAELKNLGADAQRQIVWLLEKVDLSDVANRKIGALSGGMKQRLSLCSAVLGDPEILILDEPTAGLDPAQRVALRSFISEISTEKTVLWATHIVSDVESIVSEIIWMKKGVATNSPHNIDAALSLEEKYLAYFGDIL
ncbi:MAG: ATP-binding cassette domain-containing protein [Clostridia bacterium]|nr:ATP-binding cassette domain-containing protein [Clostridia bacterium]